MPAQVLRDSPDAQDVAIAVATLKLLADESRLRIIWALLHGEHSVNELAEHVGVAASAVSQHLAKLRLAKLVSTRREGNRIFYATHDEHVMRLVEQVLFHADHVEGPTRHRDPGDGRRVSA